MQRRAHAEQIKRLALAKRWAEMLESGEQAMAHPGSRAWLDLQRLSVAACHALGKEYDSIATAIQSELRARFTDLFDRGYAVTAFRRGDKDCNYILEPYED